MSDEKEANTEPETSTAVDTAVLTQIQRAELDQQVATARAYPRSVTKFIRDCMDMATLNETIADECIYALPRRERDEGGGWIEKTIEGPSARLAEIVVSAWGNCRAGARVIEEGAEFVVAQGVFRDLQRNTEITYEVRRRITNKYGRRYSADMIGVTANAACSIALRNAVFKGVPKALWNQVYEAARAVVAGDSKTLAARRDQALELLQKVGVSRPRVLAKLGVNGTADIGFEEIVLLKGLHNSIKEGEVTAEEAFPAETVATPEPPAPAATKSQQVKNKLKVEGPHFTDESALAALRACKTVRQVIDVRTAIKRDYLLTRREIPLEVEALWHELGEALQDQEVIQTVVQP